MAFPSSNTRILSDSFLNARNLATDIARWCTQTAGRIDAGEGLRAADLYDLGSVIHDRRERLTAFVATPGLQQYAKDQLDDQTRDLAGEWTTLNTAVGDLLTWMASNLPAASQGELRQYALNADWTLAPLVLPNASLTGTFRTRLQAVIDAIE